MILVYNVTVKLLVSHTSKGGGGYRVLTCQFFHQKSKILHQGSHFSQKNSKRVPFHQNCKKILKNGSRFAKSPPPKKILSGSHFTKIATKSLEMGPDLQNPPPPKKKMSNQPFFEGEKSLEMWKGFRPQPHTLSKNNSSTSWASKGK